VEVEPRSIPFLSVLKVVGKALRLGPIRGHQDNPKQYQDFTDSHGLIVSAKIGILSETVALGQKKTKEAHRNAPLSQKSNHQDKAI
jgi:hypothetical protein